MPGNERSGNTSAHRGRKLRRHVQLSEEAARTLRALLAAFPGTNEDGIVATLIGERWAQISADAPVATTNGQVVEGPPAALPLAVAAALDAPAPALLYPDVPPVAPAAEAEAAPLDLTPLGDFVPSAYQRAVFNYIINATGNALIAAVAGSGKTTTILHAAKLIAAQRQSWMFLAFNASIEEEINAKLGQAGMKGAARTAHKIGLGTLFKRLGKKLNPAPKELKYRAIARNYVIGTVRPRSPADEKHCTAALTDLVRLARLTLTTPSDTEALREMADHYALELEPEPLKLPEPQSDHEARQQARQRAERQRECQRLMKLLIAGVQGVIEAGVRQAEADGIIDFTDMIYLPWKWQLGPKPADIVLIDECQDLSAAVLDLALKCAKPDTGRLIFVGDKSQAVYGFAGADDQAFERIIARTQATVLPLSICYRCPASHVALAQAIVPQIEARADAPEGIVAHILEDDLIERLRTLPGQALVICRVTAPLIALCIRLIGQQINARVRGREIGEQLIELLEAVLELPGACYEQFGDWLATYEQLQVERLRQRPAEDAEPLIQALTDRAAAVRVCYEAFGMPTADALADKMRSLFSKDKPDVWLSTVHKAKGLEEEHVFIYKPEKLPLVWPSQYPWQHDQEMHLRYVALTRAKQGLYFVDATLPEPDQDGEPAQWVVVHDQNAD